MALLKTNGSNRRIVGEPSNCIIYGGERHSLVTHKNTKSLGGHFHGLVWSVRDAKHINFVRNGELYNLVYGFGGLAGHLGG